jgi:hypothetical protein
MVVKRGPFKRISWGAVFAGVLIALVVQLLLSLLGLAIGFGSIDPMSESNPFAGLATGALIWWIISMLIALFVGGWAAGRLSGIFTSFDRVLHGILAFSVYSLVTFYLLTTTVGGIISGVGGLVGQTLSLAGQGVSAVAPEIAQTVQKELEEQGVTMETIKEEAEEILRQTGKPELQPENLERRAERIGDTLQDRSGTMAQNPQSADNTTGNLIDKLFTEGEDVIDEVDREAAVNVVMERTGKTRAESEQIVDNWIASYHQARQEFDTLKVKAEQQVRETGDALASAASKASLFAFLGLVFGAAASGAGASAGKPKTETVVEVEEDREVRR